ncbi:hypothetical protein C8T65DRAFT_639578 [Cerioporus squamosus]|nr:hypothetical protein C8T65DRAFT_639578 [Cerioporus squamosus]
MHLPASSDSARPALVYTPGTPDPQTPELVLVGRGRAVYFLQTPTEETVPGQASARKRAVRKAKKRVQELERMAEQLEQALLDDSAPDVEHHDEELDGDRSFCGDASFDSDAGESFSDDDSYDSDTSYASDEADSDSDAESIIITWESETSMSSASSCSSLSSSSSWSSDDAVSSIPPTLPSGFSLEDLAADDLPNWEPIESSTDPCPTTSISQDVAEQREELAATAPASIAADSVPPASKHADDVVCEVLRSSASSSNLAEYVAGGEDEESWEVELFGETVDAPEVPKALRANGEGSVVRPDRKLSRLPNQIQRTVIKTLDCAPPIMPLRCDIIFGNVVFPSLVETSMPRPLDATASISSAETPRKKRKADDDERLCKKAKHVHTVVSPAPAVSLGGAAPVVRGFHLNSTLPAKRGHQLPTPAPALLPSLVRSSHPRLPGSAKRRVPVQIHKRKRHSGDGRTDSASDSEEEIPLARLLTSPAKKLRTTVPAAMARAVAFANSAAPAPNAF